MDICGFFWADEAMRVGDESGYAMILVVSALQVLTRKDDAKMGYGTVTQEMQAR